ncbi:MAG: ABC transporter ATP-binding protein [Clostridium sp.]
MIKVKDLSFSYKDKEVLGGINFEGGDGEVICLLGPNGVGKTTLFQCMLKILKPSKGSIFISGQDIKNLKPSQMAKLIAYVPQSHNIVFNYRVIDVVLMGMTVNLKGGSPTSKDEEVAKGILKSLGIESLAYRGYENISGGERQLVLIGRAMAQNTKLLIMDEPTANLDYGNSIRVMREITSLSKKGYTIIISTHNPEHGLLYAAKALVMLNGVIDSFGEPSKIINSEMIKRIYKVSSTMVDIEAEGNNYKVCIPLLD